MKKSLIALAALAVVSAASAQSSVTLYGVADIWVGKTDAPGAKVQVGNHGLATSRWGIRGSEDLGGGLSANFNFESRVNLSDGQTNAAMFDRQANVGLSGGFGTVKIGRSWTAFDDIYGAANSGFDSALSANRVWLNNYAYSNGTNASNAQIYYATPTMGGFSGAISTKLKGNETPGELRHTAVYAKYEQGPIYAGVAYEKDDGPAVLKNTLLNGSYDLGMAKLMASYYNTKTGVGIATNSYQLGADIPMGGALTLSVGYASSKLDVAGAKSSTGFGIAAGYSLSKRTTAYAGVRAANVVGNDLWAVGINHKF